jgi:hypothetical protein
MFVMFDGNRVKPDDVPFPSEIVSAPVPTGELPVLLTLTVNAAGKVV